MRAGRPLAGVVRDALYAIPRTVCPERVRLRSAGAAAHPKVQIGHQCSSGSSSGARSGATYRGT